MNLKLPETCYDSIRAKQFALVDNKGVERAAMATDDTGSPSLAMFNSDGRPRFILALDAEDAMVITIADSKGNSRLAIDDSTGRPRICFSDEDGRSGFILTIGEGGHPLVSWEQDGRKMCAILMADRDDYPEILFLNAESVANRVAARRI